MKLVIAIIPQRLIRRLRDILCAEGYGFTELAGRGGFFREGNATLLIGVAEERVPDLLHLLEAYCQPRQESVNLPSGAAATVHVDPSVHVADREVGGCMIFVLNIEQVVHL